MSDHRFYSRCTGTIIDLVVNMPIESALRLGDCTKICVIAEVAEGCLHCSLSLKAEAGHSRRAIFKSLSTTCLV